MKIERIYRGRYCVDDGYVYIEVSLPTGAEQSDA